MKKVILILLLMVIFIAGNVNAEEFFELGERTLRRGDEGVDVALLQQRLAQLDLYNPKDIDGIYGRATEEAVKKLQRLEGLVADGIFGPRTLEVLPSEDQVTASRSNPEREDILLLARIVHGEARGEPFKGQVGVAAVVLNRLQDSQFPHTIREVVMEGGQFCSINDGQVNLYPTEISLNAARAALMGYDPTYGALFFYNPRTSTNNWIARRPVARQIGNHVFSY